MQMGEYKQLSIFDYQPPRIDFPQFIADDLVKHCEKWGYDFVEQLKEKGGEQFYNIFCRITKTYFVDRSHEVYYEVEFSKDGKAVVKRCGKGFDKRGPDTIVNIQDIVSILLNGKGGAR